MATVEAWEVLYQWSDDVQGMLIPMSVWLSACYLVQFIPIIDTSEYAHQSLEAGPWKDGINHRAIANKNTPAYKGNPDSGINLLLFQQAFNLRQ